MLAQVATDPSPWLQGGAAGAVLLAFAMFLVALKWIVERQGRATEKVGEQLTGELRELTAATNRVPIKLDEIHREAIRAVADMGAHNTAVMTEIKEMRTESERRHEEVMRLLSHRA